MYEYTPPDVSQENHKSNRGKAPTEDPTWQLKIERHPSELAAEGIFLGEHDFGYFKLHCKAAGIDMVMLRGGRSDFEARSRAGQIYYDKVYYWTPISHNQAEIFNLPPAAERHIPKIRLEVLRQQLAQRNGR